jgi:hypothetical protein
MSRHVRASETPWRHGVDAGLALLAVLVALGFLLAITMPFVLSMGRGDARTRGAVDEAQVGLAVRSARDVLLAAAARGVGATDPTPLTDGRDEFPSALELPEGFAGIERAGVDRHVLQGELEDLSRRAEMASATPLLYANLLGLVARTRDKIELDATEIELDGDAAAFPESGHLFVGREVIRYGTRSGNRFGQLERGVFAELGYFPAQAFPDYEVPPLTAVLDFRCVLAVQLGIDYDGQPTTFRPLAAVGELGRLATLGMPGFEAHELARLERFLSGPQLRESSARFGKPERVFSILLDETQQPRILRVKSAVGMGPGRIVRLRSLDGKLIEYALVNDAIDRGPDGIYEFGSGDHIGLTRPLTQPFEVPDVFVEPVVSAPVNINTAEPELLGAILANLRRPVPGVQRDGDHRQTSVPPALGPAEARQLADTIVAMRGDAGLADAAGLPDGLEVRPFDGFEDLATRFLPLMLGDASGPSSMARRQLVIAVYDGLQIGATKSLEQGTLPVAFHSGQLVRYRASASRQRITGREVARRELSGIALAMPRGSVVRGAATQEALDDAFRLDRRSPFWQTWPKNTNAVQPIELNDIPVLHTSAHLLANLFQDAGFGNPRFPARTGTAGSLRPQPASTPLALPRNVFGYDSFLTAQHPEGRDRAAEGTYFAQNSGPRAGVASGAQRTFDHSRITYPFTGPGGLTAPFAARFWARIDQSGPTALFDYAREDGEAERNRISLTIRDNKLVLEVLDEAGIDPNPSSPYAPQRGAGGYEVALDQLGFTPNAWYHLAVSATGNRPGQVSLLVDGVPRGQARMRTWLTQPLQAYRPSVGGEQFLEESERYIDVRVDSTEGFPDRGVLKIGLELFEYSARDSNSFRCRFADSAGGRRARATMRDFAVEIPRDDDGNPREDLLKRINGDLDATVPDHVAGAAVELYGYSIPVSPAVALQPGSATLTDSVGAFAVARAANQSNLSPIVIQAQRPVLLGRGIDMNWSGDIDLADPVADRNYPPNAASDAIASAFPQSGGFALMVQRRLRFELRTLNPGQLSTPAEVGGVEIIRYASRNGTKLTGVQRAVSIPGLNLQGDANQFFVANSNRQFVLDWAPALRFPGTNLTLNELPRYMTFVVPISLSFNGLGVNDRSTLVEWVQIKTEGGDDTDTEWVRYNSVVERRFLVRAEQPAYDRLRFALTNQNGLEVLGVDQNSGSNDPIDAELSPWPQPYSDGRVRIGSIDPIETQHPVIHWARKALGFRGDAFVELGDPSMATSSRPHAANTPILPVHRFEFDWPSYGLGAPRAGRGDRVAMVTGSARLDAQTPTVEWHDVNWVVRHPSFDQLDPAQTQPRTAGQGRELLGNFPFQLVAFKAQLRNVYVGAGGPVRSEENLNDSRLLDRMVKYPSGELPAADPDDAHFGEAVFGDVPSLAGILDEVEVLARRPRPRPLDQAFAENANTFYVRPNVALQSSGPLVNATPRQWPTFGNADQFPQQGGLLQIDGEYLAYSNFDPSTGLVTVAQNGRGLLGTTPRAHDESAIVEFIDHVPCGILSSGVSDRDAEIPLQSLEGFPVSGGTVLIGSELAHYTWRRGAALAMPTWRDPDREHTQGLFRGRFGSIAQAWPAGAPVLAFPFRYWDRQRDRADDPESAFLQVSVEPGPVWFDGFGWKTEGENPLVFLRALVRVDERAPFDADPQANPGLRLLLRGDQDGAPIPIRQFGERFEARFEQVYRPGAFDGVTFLAQDWKRAITVEWFVASYEGETTILSEEVSAR